MKLLMNTILGVHDHNCRLSAVEGQALIELTDAEAALWNEGGDIRDEVTALVDADLKGDGQPFTVKTWKATPCFTGNACHLTLVPWDVEPTPFDDAREYDPELRNGL